MQGRSLAEVATGAVILAVALRFSAMPCLTAAAGR